MKRIILTLIVGLGIASSIQAAPLFGRLFLRRSNPTPKVIMTCEPIDMNSGWTKYSDNTEQKYGFTTSVMEEDTSDYYYVVLNKTLSSDGILFKAGISEAVQASGGGGFEALLEDLDKIEKVSSPETAMELGTGLPHLTAKFEISHDPCP